MSNKYTAGKEYYTLDGTLYKGFYHEVRGKYYTGKRHVFGVSQELTSKGSSESLTFYIYALKYKLLINSLKFNTDDLLIVKYPLEPTTDLYSNVYVVKYKPTGKFFLVTSKSFSKLASHPLIKPYSIKVKNTGTFLRVSYNKKQLYTIDDFNIRRYVSIYRQI